MNITYTSLNLWRGGILRDSAIDFLQKHASDILVLQEVHSTDDPALPIQCRAMQTIPQELGYTYTAYAPTFFEIKNNSRVEQGNAILSRLPIVSNEAIFFDIPYGEDMLERTDGYTQRPRNMIHVTYDIEGKKLHVFGIQGIWGTDGLDNPRRLSMSKTIVEHVTKYDNVILSGDFNVRPNTQSIRQIETHLRNVFAGKLSTTFNMQQKKDPVFGEAVVDMIFVSPHIKTSNEQCPKVDISDHLPLLCTIDSDSLK